LVRMLDEAPGISIVTIGKPGVLFKSIPPSAS